MRPRLASALVGLVFGAVLAWSGMASPDVLREGLLLEDSYLYLFFLSALGTAFVGLRLLNRRRRRALVTGEPITCPVQQPERRHVAGGAIFGLGWGIAAVCPGPIAVQLGQGIPWSLAIGTGLVLGIWLFLRREAASVPLPATEQG
jgi:uncharacterized protein